MPRLLGDHSAYSVENGGKVGRVDIRTTPLSMDGGNDLKSPGVQKMLLDELERADAECEGLQSYASRFHDADKRAAVLEETRSCGIMMSAS